MSAAALIRQLEEINPDAVRLAESVSFAVMVDRALLRAARLELVPRVDAGVEADLWFSLLVQSRTSDGIVLDPDVAEALRRRMTPSRVESVWKMTRREHAWIAPSLRVEEEIAYLSVSDAPTAGEDLAHRLQSVLSAMVEGERTGLAQWARRALTMFPSAARDLPEAKMLETGARLRLGETIAERRERDEEMPSWLPWLVPASLDRVVVALELDKGVLEIFVGSTTAAGVAVEVPDTNPLLLEISWDEAEGRRTKQVAFRRGETVSLPVGSRGLRIRTITGEAYGLREQDHVPGRLREHGAVSGKGWSDKSEYKKLKRELRALSRDAFADRVLELLRIRWPECMTAPRLKAIDRKGVDLFVWDELAVQCKGFEVDEVRLGRSQIGQCLESIEKFRRSDVRAERYLLIHNRDGSDEGFRVEVGNAVEALATGGRVGRAELWDVQRLLREVFNGMSDRITDALTVAANRNVAEFGAFDAEPLPVVPLRLSNLTIDRHRLESEEPAVEMLADPAVLLLTSDGPHLTLLIGEAGYGKTTAARRAFRSATQKVFFIPAARIDSRVVGTKDLLDRCIDLEELLEIADVGDSPLWKFVARPVLENLFKDPTTNAVLLFDGLDESPFFARERGAFQHFFNFFNLLKVPVVFTARTEFWTQRKYDLEQQFGKVGEHKGGIRKHVRQIELREWNEPQMVALAHRHRETLEDAARARIDELIRLIESGSYATYYGDIPRRPLFLRMILDTVTERDVHRISRAALVEEWALLKVTRDVEESQRWGTSGRPPIAGETAKRDTIGLAFEVMEAAAASMFGLAGDFLFFYPDCEIRKIADRVPAVAALSDPTGLVLNTLLVPVDNNPTQRPRVRFAHLLFQEYFLARYLAGHPEEWRRGVHHMPPDTKRFLAELQQR